MYIDLDQFNDLWDEGENYLKESRDNGKYEDQRYDEGYMQGLRDVARIASNNRATKIKALEEAV